MEDVAFRVDGYIGLDLDREVLRATRASRRAGSRYELVAGSALRLPFRDRVFRSTLLLRVLHLVEDPDRALAEIHRVLEPGGVLVLSVMPRPNVMALGMRLCHRLRPTGPGPARSWDRAPRMESLRRTKRRLESAGFAILEEHRSGLEGLPGFRWMGAPAWLRIGESLPTAPLFPSAILVARKPG